MKRLKYKLKVWWINLFATHKIRSRYKTRLKYQPKPADAVILCDFEYDLLE